jgi:hypothetical protein
MSPRVSPPWAHGAVSEGGGYSRTSAGWRGSSCPLRARRGILRRCLGCRAGHVEEALVLLLGLVQHDGQLCDMILHGALAFLVGPFPFLRPLELFT